MNTRSIFLSTIALALSIGAAATADTRQLAASAGVDPAAAGGYSTLEIVELKFNGEARRDDRHPIVVPVAAPDPAARAQLAAAAGVGPAQAETMTLTELATAKNDREARGQDRVAQASRAVDGGAGRAQIVASIGLDPEIGRTMSFHDIYLMKIVRESADD